MYKATAEKGKYNIKSGRTGAFLHSAYSPEREAQAAANAAVFGPGDLAVLLGNGAGYLSGEAYARGVRNFLIIEPSQEIIDLCFKRKAAARQLTDSGVEVFFLTPENFKIEWLVNIILLKINFSFKVRESAYFKKEDAAFAAKAAADITTALAQAAKLMDALGKEKFFEETKRNDLKAVLSEILFSADRQEAGL